MFRKYYKEANDSIKPSEDFVNSVIRDAKNHKPPLRARYTQYAAVAAAAVVVVTGAVTAFPLLQKAQRDGGEGVVIEERATESGTAATTSPAQTTAPTAAPTDKIGDEKNTAQPLLQEPKKTDTPNTSESSYNVPDDAPSKPAHYTPEKTERDYDEQEYTAEDNTNQSNMYEPDTYESDIYEPDTPEPAVPSDAQKTDTNENNGIIGESAETEGTDSGGGSSGSSGAKAILGESDEIIRQENTAPEDMTPYSEKQDLSDMSDADTETIDDPDLPCPDGYYCIDASPNGYTFKNDGGAVISVTINYGGADREPYITEENGSIYAVFTSFGLSVTINAYGADMAAVEEIINQFR